MTHEVILRSTSDAAVRCQHGCLEHQDRASLLGPQWVSGAEFEPGIHEIIADRKVAVATRCCYVTLANRRSFRDGAAVNSEPSEALTRHLTEEATTKNPYELSEVVSGSHPARLLRYLGGVSTSEPSDADVPSPATLGRSGPVRIVMIRRYDVKRVVELMPSEDFDVRDAFGLVLQLPSRTCENLNTLVAEPSAPWREFLSIRCQHMGKGVQCSRPCCVHEAIVCTRTWFGSQFPPDDTGKSTQVCRKERRDAVTCPVHHTVSSKTTTSAEPGSLPVYQPLKSVGNQSSPFHGIRLESSSNLNDDADDSPCSSPQRSGPKSRVQCESYGYFHQNVLIASSAY
ncbi:hypothetical protein HPB51_022979 [Rhipicephalus microplus]|uniref:Uncharacterized protein n=1 Tax=Rhipicephalus microplus TaxID=6941 RepID=A0A9J6DDF3_RHIMP|nr:hypothetical protein HPB51_022979 [Rhipicephalus microplus]